MTTDCPVSILTAEAEAEIAAIYQSGNFDLEFLSKFGIDCAGGERVRRVYNMLDRNKDEILIAADLKDLMKILLCNPELRPLTDAETNKVMAAADTNGNGKITLKEFHDMLKKLNHGGCI